MQDVGSKENTRQTQTEPRPMARVPCQSLGHRQSVGTEACPPVSKSIERYPYQSRTRRFLQKPEWIQRSQIRCALHSARQLWFLSAIRTSPIRQVNPGRQRVVDLLVIPHC